MAFSRSENMGVLSTEEPKSICATCCGRQHRIRSPACVQLTSRTAPGVVGLDSIDREVVSGLVARLRTIDQPNHTRGQAMNNRLTQLIAEMDKDDAKKIETLTGVIAIGGYLREVAADEDQRDPKIDAAGRTIVTNALRYMLGRAPTAEEIEQVLSGGF